MSWWGAAAGAGVGGLIAGPLGAMAGGAMGGLLDALLDGDDQSGDALPAELQWADEEDGRQILLLPEFDARKLDSFVCHVVDADGDYVAGRRSYKDGDGDFVVVAWFDDEAGVAAAFIPSGAVDVESGATTQLLVSALDDEGELMGHSLFEITWPQQRKFSVVPLVRPLIDLAVLVARADGAVDQDERDLIQRMLRDAFELSPRETSEVGEALRELPPIDIEQAVSRVFLRLPRVAARDVLDLLVSVAECDQVVTSEEVAEIRSIALEFGLAPGDWDAMARELGLVGGSNNLAEAYACLELQEGASAQEVKAAFRRLIRDYHPDTVAQLPLGFQEYAAHRTIEIRRAYELLTMHQARV